MKTLTGFILFVIVSCISATLSDNSWSGRVIGGENAKVGEFPHMVSLRKSGSHNCGGSIIAARVILTAAHCVVRARPESFVVVTGSTTLSSGGNKHNVSEIITHENYTSEDSWRNDVAILKLSTPIAFSSLEQPILLPEQDEKPEESEAIVSGWGYTTYPPTGLPNDLQKVKLKLVSNEKCNNKHKIPVYSTHLCAGTINGEGVCNGDSGGPLLSAGKQVGVVSWGRPCAVGYPDVYTRVASYTDWIAEKSA